MLPRWGIGPAAQLGGLARWMIDRAGTDSVSVRPGPLSGPAACQTPQSPAEWMSPQPVAGGRLGHPDLPRWGPARRGGGPLAVSNTEVVQRLGEVGQVGGVVGNQPPVRRSQPTSRKM